MHGMGTLLLFHIVTSLGQNVHGSDIIHGEKAPENSMQYMVSLQNKTGHHVCGGFLVSEDFVLPTSSNANLKDGQICSVAGWGKTGTNHFTVDDLRVVNVSILNPQLCREKWGDPFPSNVICAGGYDTDKGFCQGDSGGPLVCNQVAVGVVSFNNRANCDYPDVPNVYTDISKYLPWINYITKTKKCV
ncbi:kallikrein-13-like [Poecilia formosa]|uniref:kallikrein-13-like n=1 Tax=Poecilia formosa TaxID=48698 RepID=UPI00044410C2|nr:PREDICTED: kallikrein-13-like [Poecilia formosa]